MGNNKHLLEEIARLLALLKEDEITVGEYLILRSIIRKAECIRASLARERISKVSD